MSDPVLPPELRVQFNIKEKNVSFPFYIQPPPFPFKIVGVDLVCANQEARTKLTLTFHKGGQEAGRATFNANGVAQDTITGATVMMGEKSQAYLTTSSDLYTDVSGEFILKLDKP